MNLFAEKRGRVVPRCHQQNECRPRLLDDELQEPAVLPFDVALQLSRSAIGDDPSGIHEGEPIAMLCFAEIVSRDEYRDLFLTRQPGEQLPKPSPADRV